MNIYLLTSFKFIAGLMLLSASAFASADHKGRNFDYARVTQVKPIYQTVTRRVPVANCRVETVRVDHRRHNDGAALVGSLVGAAIGHDLGRSRHSSRVGAVAGAIIGASIGHEVSDNRTRVVSEYRDVERCITRYETERFEKLVGYNVTYRYHGQNHYTRTDSHPGNRIRVSVSIRPEF